MLCIHITGILVSYFYGFEVEWFRVAVPGPDCAPFCVGATDGIFNGVKMILDERFHFVKLPIVTVAYYAGQTGVDNEHRLGSNVFAELEKIVVADAAAVVIAPQIHLAHTLDAVSYGLLPLDAVLHREAFHYAAARPADE